MNLLKPSKVKKFLPYLPPPVSLASNLLKVVIMERTFDSSINKTSLNLLALTFPDLLESNNLKQISKLILFTNEFLSIVANRNSSRSISPL